VAQMHTRIMPASHTMPGRHQLVHDTIPLRPATLLEEW